MSELFPRHRIQVLLPLPLSGVLDYLMPEEMNLGLGDFVTVPLPGREMQGVVWSINPENNDIPIEKLKSVIRKAELPPLPESLIKFVEWVAHYTLSPAGSVLKMALSVPRKFDKEKKKIFYHLSNDLPEKMTPTRQKIIDVAVSDMPMAVKTWCEISSVSEGVVRGMIKAGMLIPVEVSGEEKFINPDIEVERATLSSEQHDAAQHIITQQRNNKFRAILLEGVTGSGKTEVYFEAVAEALKDETAQVLVLVPEISLTAQWLERFEERFGAAPVIWHSEMTPAQRRRAWWATIRGEAKVIVGARSALFLPLKNLKLLIVDEEHSQTFKQDEGVMYHGRDMAVVRAMQSRCPVVLASATPSLETMINAEGEKYDWLYLGERHGPAELPSMSTIDLRHHKLKTGSWISAPLYKALKENLENGEQSLLYLNRRGYAPLTLCRTCGHRFECPHCSAWLVEHQRFNKLECHHCGFNQRVPEICPGCEAEDSLVPCGPGVERVAEEVATLFPDARLAIMSSDEVTSPTALKRMVESIERHEVDLIIGTQIITKGYHFPMLTLVGVIDADLGMSGADPRAAERTWQQLEQVAGRAGRANHEGRVLFQTYQPEHPVLEALVSGDKDLFLEREAAAREEQNLPPYGKLASLILSGPDKRKIADFTKGLSKCAPHYDDVTVLGPVPAPLSYLRGNYRYRFLIKAEAQVNIQRIIKDWLDNAPKSRGVRTQVDIDPYSFY
ncbi:MAG: primosomal protein N' [Emcibacteraceae bacterium]|nr:primosomal protein N' [Emcibacteraceae bacterium]